jgi:hypothetical protein
MSSVIYERIAHEAEVARRWRQLPPQTLLPLADGQRCLLIYAGEPGGPAGPDIRDAVLYFLPRDPDVDSPADGLASDVEFHTRVSDWFAHGHHTDPRYNHVLLHVVLYLDSEIPTRRQDGVEIPICSLLDLPQTPVQTPPWPCQQTPLTAMATTNTLLHAGLLRFNEKSLALSESLARISSSQDLVFSAYDTCLLPALAEALGYGRDRAFFRAAGLRLVGLPTRIPEPLGHTQHPAPLDADRMRILSTLSARWQHTGIWPTLLPAFQPDLDVKSALAALRVAFQPLSRARTDILICNVVLPFAAAVAKLENDTHLAARARQLYIDLPALASNRVTRMMSAQLQLSAEPEQACLQQGLHYIYARNCQTKRCGDCLCGERRL